MRMNEWNNLTGTPLALPLADGRAFLLAAAGPAPTVEWGAGDFTAEPDGVEVRREVRPKDIDGFPTAPGRHILLPEVVQAARELGCRSDGHIYAWDEDTRTLTVAFGWPGAGALDEEDEESELGAAA